MLQPEAPSVETNFRNFYDPNNTLPLSGILDYVNNTRRASLVGPLGAWTVPEVLTTESAHMLLIPGGQHADFASLIGSTTANVEATVAAAQHYAANVATALLETIPQVSFQIPPGSKQPSDTVKAGILFAAHAHGMAKRRSGRLYFSHPEDVASILSIVWGRRQPTSREEHDTSLCLAYTHDTTEHLFEKSGGTFLRPDDVMVTPLVMQHTLRLLGVPDADAGAEAQFLLSKPIGPNGKMSYGPYIWRGLPSRYFKLIKMADIWHNRHIEPNIGLSSEPADQKIISTRNAHYDAALMLISHIINTEETNTDYINMIDSITTVTRQDIQAQGLSLEFDRARAARLLTQKFLGHQNSMTNCA